MPRTIWRRWGHVLPRNYASSKMDQANNESSSRPAVSAWQVEVVIKEEEVRRHNQVSDAWISFNGAVYDITKYVHRHPPCPGPGNCMIFTSTAGLSDISSFFLPMVQDRLGPWGPPLQIWSYWKPNARPLMRFMARFLGARNDVLVWRVLPSGCLTWSLWSACDAMAFAHYVHPILFKPLQENRRS